MSQKKLCENPACQFENDVHLKFCVSCGHPFTITSQPIEETPRTTIEPNSTNNAAPICTHETNGGKFCIKCGEQVHVEPSPVSSQAPNPNEAGVCVHETNGGNFCVKCGEQVKSDPIPPTQSKTATEPKPKANLDKQTTHVNPATKKRNKIIAIVAVVLIAALGGTWFALQKTLSNKDAITATMKEVVVSNDAQTFYEALTIEEASDEEKAAYEQYLQGEDVSSLADAIIKSMSKLHNSDELLANVAAEGSDVKQFKVTKAKKFGLFPAYEIQPLKFSVMTNTNSDAMELTFAGETIQLAMEEELELGKFLPGNYAYTLTWKTDFAQLDKELEATVLPEESNYVDGAMEHYAVELADGPFEDWEYTLNDKKVDLMALAPNGRFEVPEGLEVDMVASFKEGDVTYTSEAQTLIPYKYIDFYFPKYEEKLAQEEVKEQAQYEIAELIENYLWIYSNGYVQDLSDVIAKDSTFYSQQTKYLLGLNNKSIQSHAYEHDIANIVENENGSYTVTVNEKYEVISPDADTKNINQKSIYTVKLIDGQYYITALKLG